MSIRVTFKAEGECNGIDIGPCQVIDVEVYDRSVLQVQAEEDLPVGIPWGFRPAGVTDHGWITIGKALDIASNYGVLLDIS